MSALHKLSYWFWSC